MIIVNTDFKATHLACPDKKTPHLFYLLTSENPAVSMDNISILQEFLELNRKNRCGV